MPITITISEHPDGFSYNSTGPDRMCGYAPTRLLLARMIAETVIKSLPNKKMKPRSLTNGVENVSAKGNSST
jgi:hypothetical protein